MLQDISFTFRSLRRQPGFALAAIATLAVGIAATTAIFSTVNATLLRPLPFPHSEDLFWLTAPATDGRFTTGRDSGVEIMGLNVPEVSIVRAAGVGKQDQTIIRDDNTPVPAVLAFATEGFFELFGLPMTIGGFTHQNFVAAPNQPPNVVLSYRLWRDMFASDPNIVGKSIRFANGPLTIAGVANRDFDIPHGADVWVPAIVTMTAQSTGHGFDGYVRIKPGTNLARLRSEMAAVMSGLARQFGPADANRRYDIKPLVTAMVGDLGPMLVTVLGAAGLLLLLACVNVTNLLLARGAVRSREIAVRVALGAGRGRIVRQLLTESLVLATAGTIVGLGLAFAGVRILLLVGAAQLPRLESIPFDLRVLGFALAALLVTGLLVGFAPALRLAGTNLRTLMNESGRSNTGSGAANRMLKGMIVAEIALAITLVAGAGWLVRSFSNLGTSDPGFTAAGRLTFDVLLPGSRYRTPAQVADWTRMLGERLHGIGGITAVASTSTLPFRADRDSVLYLGVQGQAVDPDHPRVARAHRVSPNFFETMGIKLTAGRGFTDDDRQAGAPVAIVNRTFVRRYLEGRDPLTSAFSAGYPDVPAAPLLKIVGVVDDVKYVSLAEAADPAYYQPQAQAPYFQAAFIVNTSVPNPAALSAQIREAVKAMDPLIPVDFTLMSDILAESLTRYRLGMMLMLLFAGAALVLAAVGIYGVIAYSSAQRVGEVATRIALGATPANIFWLMMRQGRMLAIAGTVIGLAVAFGAERVVASRLFEVTAFDPLILATATGLVLAITFISIVLPARRAARVEPSQVLRAD